jgi:hypothetical protein
MSRRVICCDGAQIIVEIGVRWAEHSTRVFHRGIVPPVGKQKVTSRVVRPLCGHVRVRLPGLT